MRGVVAVVSFCTCLSSTNKPSTGSKGEKKLMLIQKDDDRGGGRDGFFLYFRTRINLEITTFIRWAIIMLG